MFVDRSVQRLGILSVMDTKDGLLIAVTGLKENVLEGSYFRIPF